MKTQLLPALCLLAAALPAFGQARGFFGAGLADAQGGGARVGALAPGGPAEKGGVRLGDVIVAVANRPAGNSQAAAQALAQIPAGQKVNLTVLRDGQRTSLSVLMATPPAAGAEAAVEGHGAAAPPAAAPAAAAGPPKNITPLKVTSYAVFTEPTERAFTMEVPRGWEVTGSQMRRAALEFSPFVRTLSPDKMTYLMVGEPTLLTYTPPMRPRSGSAGARVRCTRPSKAA